MLTSQLRIAALMTITVCAGEVDAQVRDSLGVSIITLRPPASPAATLRPGVVGQIGGGSRGPNYEFTGLTGGRFTPGGGVMLAATTDIRFFDASGTWARSLGRSGSGPGEFRIINEVCLLADGSVIAFDSPNRRLTRFDNNGTVAWVANSVRTLQFCLNDGSMLVSSSLAAPGFPALRSDLAPKLDPITGAPGGTRFSRMSLDKEPRFLSDVAVAAPLPMGPMVRRQQPNGTVVIVRAAIPFNRVRSVAVVADRVCVAEGIRYEVRCHDIRTHAVSLLRMDRPAVRVTEAMKRLYTDATLAPLSGEQRSARASEIAAIGYAETLPPYGRVMSDDVGRLWIQDYRMPRASTQEWSVFRMDGTFVNRVAFPADLILLDIRGDRVLGWSRDGDGFAVAKTYTLGTG
jgi:hypothetical protein